MTLALILIFCTNLGCTEVVQPPPLDGWTMASCTRAGLEATENHGAGWKCEIHFGSGRKA